MRRCRTHPRTQVSALDDESLSSLFDAKREVLDVAIDGKADPDALPADRFMLPHRQGDQKDPYSGTPLETVTGSGRTGYYSPARQPPP